MTDILAEKLVPLRDLKNDPDSLLKGVVRIVDEGGYSRGLFFDNQALEDMLEDWCAGDPEFIQSLDTSRASGRVSAEELKRAIGL